MIPDVVPGARIVDSRQPRELARRHEDMRVRGERQAVSRSAADSFRLMCDRAESSQPS